MQRIPHFFVAWILLSCASMSLAVDDQYEDLLLITERSFAVLRVHVDIGEISHKARWKLYQKQLFDLLDRNNDGAVTKAEANRAPRIIEFRQLIWSTNSSHQPLLMLPRLEQDTDPRNGSLSPREFKRWLENSGLRAMAVESDQSLGLVQKQRAINMANRRGAQRRVPDLLAILDKDRDKSLSNNEFSNAISNLAKLDLDDDGSLSSEELSLFAVQESEEDKPIQSRVRSPGVANLVQGPTLGPLSVIGHWPDKSTMAAELVAKLDRPNPKSYDFKLDANEAQLPSRIWNAIDRNNDNILSSAELTRFLNQPSPTAEIRLAMDSESTTPFLLQQAVDKQVARRFDSKQPSLQLGGLEVLIKRIGAEKDALGTIVESEFQRSNKDGNGYLSRQEASQSPVLRSFLVKADRDNNGMIFKPELRHLFERFRPGYRSRIILRFMKSNSQLFDAIDLNRDRRLSLKELKSANKRIKAWDSNGDNRLSAKEIPNTIQIHMGFVLSETLLLSDALRNSNGTQINRGNSLVGIGPVWFDRMDRNSDLELTPREFLGTEAQFNTLDRDDDGVVTRAEAREFETTASRSSSR